MKHHQNAGDDVQVESDAKAGSESPQALGDGVPIRESRHADASVSDLSPRGRAMDDSPRDKIQEDRSGERSSGAVRKVKPIAEKSEEMLETDDDVRSLTSHSHSPSMENLYESTSASDDAAADSSYSNIFKTPEDKVFDTLIPVKEKREYFTFTLTSQDSQHEAPSLKVAALKKRFEAKPSAERVLARGVAFHDLSVQQREFFDTGKLDAGEVKPSEEVLDIQDPDSAHSLVRKTNLNIGTTRESFQKAKRMFENN